METTLSHNEKIQQANDSTLTSNNQASNATVNAQNSDIITSETESREQAEQRIENDIAANKPVDEKMHDAMEDRRRA